ncbi:prothymosin alpha-B-like [Carica papaya]|uniref:prothymosin alpha-B-like n=1 Tax=Carica papaya TaxID=3649 RepID=UPI000B8CF92E|nr:prothymosin alpha-B-like [Carica papaya]
MGIERYTDIGKPKITSRRKSLYQFLQLGYHNFPKELIGESRREQRHLKKVRWHPDADLQKLDLFEKLEQKHQGQEDKDGKEKKEGEDEDEDEDGGPEDEEEYSDDGDYNQNIDFDDDEDDYNMEDDNDDEPIL